MDAQTAEMLWQSERGRVAEAQERALYEQWRAGQELEEASRQYPDSDPEFVRAYSRATGRPIGEIARLSQEYRRGIEQEVLARYQAQKAAASASPAPEGAAGESPTPGRFQTNAWKLPWRSLFGIGGGPA
jgi:hypothetical protein